MLSFNFGFTQGELPFFEQIAFDLYKDSIIQKHPVDKRIKITKFATDLHTDKWYRFSVTECLTGKSMIDGKELEVFNIYALQQQMNIDSPKYEMNYNRVNKKQFKIKNSKTSSYPYLRISQPYHKINNFEEFYINVIEYHKNWSITYFVIIDKTGKVKKWCRDNDIEILVH